MCVCVCVQLIVVVTARHSQREFAKVFSSSLYSPRLLAVALGFLNLWLVTLIFYDSIIGTAVIAMMMTMMMMMRRRRRTMRMMMTMTAVVVLVAQAVTCGDHVEVQRMTENAAVSTRTSHALCSNYALSKSLLNLRIKTLIKNWF